MGLSVGIYSAVTPQYSIKYIYNYLVNEISPTHLTGALGSLHQLLITLAIVITYLIGITLPKQGLEYDKYSNNITWRIGMLIPGILSLIQIILMLFLYKFDSPVYYLSEKQNKLVHIL